MGTEPSKSSASRGPRRAVLAALCIAALSAPSRAGSDGPTLLWSQDSGSEGWLPRAVSIGNYGTQVFSQVGPFLDYTRLMSGHDTSSPPTPVWTRSDPRWTYEHRVDSADEASVHVAVHKSYVSGSSGPKNPILQKFTSSSSSPDWEFTFPITHTSNEQADVAVSADGGVIVATAFESASADTRVAVFGPGSSSPQSYTLVDTTGAASTVLLSADGSTLYICSNNKLTLFDVQSAQTIWSTVVFDGPLRKGHAISTDGRTIAFGAANDLRIYRRSGNSYSQVHEHVLPSNYRADALAISADGSTLVCGSNHQDGLTIRALALNLSNYQLSMSYQTTGSGGQTNVVSDIGISPNGARFAVGTWGDQAGLVPEVLFFDSRQDQPLGSHSFPGSTLSLDFAADGEHVVVASKGVHANEFGGGGRISLFEVRPDFRMRGVPVAGRDVNFDLFASLPIPASGVLLMSHSPAAVPETFPGAGTLYLNRQDLTFLSMGSIDNGIATRTITLSDSMPPGTNLYFQGLIAGLRLLSNDWVVLTVLPPP